jgi:hypothetical protein
VGDECWRPVRLAAHEDHHSPDGRPGAEAKSSSILNDADSHANPISSDVLQGPACQSEHVQTLMQSMYMSTWFRALTVPPVGAPPGHGRIRGRRVVCALVQIIIPSAIAIIKPSDQPGTVTGVTASYPLVDTARSSDSRPSGRDGEHFKELN